MNLYEAANTVPIDQVAALCGLALRRTREGRWRCNCPFHPDKNPSCYFYAKPGRGDFYCFSCGAHGDVVDLYARIEGVEGYQAAKLICAHFGVAWDKGRQGAHKPQPVSLEARAVLALCAEWRSIKIRLCESEVHRCTRLLETAQSPDDYLWPPALEEASRWQDEANRYAAMSSREMLEDIVAELAGGVREVKMLGYCT